MIKQKRPAKSWLEQIRTLSHGSADGMVRTIFVEIDAQAELIATLAQLLKERELPWGGADYNDCLSCRARGDFDGIDGTWSIQHKPDCELAAALKQAGVDVAVEGP